MAIRSSTVTGLVRLLPYEAAGDDWIVAYDSSARRRHQAADFVIGVGLASRTLASMTVRPHVERCLDLGTGNGVQAVHAHRHAGVVVATDRNARAVAFAAFTAALNRIANVTAREGSLFDPVQGERFGLIVSNPPFIISPEASFAWRDGGLPLDGLCRRIVAEAPAHLERDGWCQLLANWVHPGDGDWRRRLAGWFEGTGCDVWVIQRQVEDAERYAARWIGYEGLDATGAEEAFDAWMEHYRQADVAAVGYGLITMRRSSGAAPWVRIDELTQDFELPCGDAIQAGFERFAWLADVGHDDRRLLAARLRAADDVRLDERRVLCAGSWESRNGRAPAQRTDCAKSALPTRRPRRSSPAAMEAASSVRSWREWPAPRVRIRRASPLARCRSCGTSSSRASSCPTARADDRRTSAVRGRVAR